MSFILDALRKVDRENREADVVVPPVAAVEKLRKEKRSRRSQFAAMAAIGVLSALATTLLLQQAPAPEVSEAPIENAENAENTEAAEIAENVEIPSAEPETAAALPVVDPAPATRESPQQPQPSPVEEASVDVAGPELAPAPELEPQAPEPAVPELPRLVLQGTSILAGKSVAVVSDRRVFVGDFIEGALVVRIEERLVELEFGGRRFTLTF
ncbi:MAG TPA: hypothetical protein VJ921_10080 [Vicinamibacteria bacterium]|nr:hypothetical protein [Vicinamibacteria bacterium]